MIVRGQGGPAWSPVGCAYPGGVDFIDAELLQFLGNEWIESQVSGQRRSGWIVDGIGGIEILSGQDEVDATFDSDHRPRGLLGRYRTEPDDGISVGHWPEPSDLEAGWRLGFGVVVTRRGLLVIRRDADSTGEMKRVSVWSPESAGWVTISLPRESCPEA